MTLQGKRCVLVTRNKCATRFEAKRQTVGLCTVGSQSWDPGALNTISFVNFLLIYLSGELSEIINV